MVAEGRDLHPGLPGCKQYSGPRFNLYGNAVYLNMYDTQLIPPNLILVDFNGAELTSFHTYTTLGTDGLVNDVNLFPFARDCFNRTLSCTSHTTDTFLGIDRVPDQFLTGTTGTALVHNVGHILVLEMLDR
jgi:hypothetical protein